MTRLDKNGLKKEKAEKSKDSQVVYLPTSQGDVARSQAISF